MIVTLEPRADFAPVPRVEIRFQELTVLDGGGPGDVGELLDGGSPLSTGPVLDGGAPAMVSVELPEGTDRVTLWRRCAGRAMKVRGAVSRQFAGSGGFLDLEAGFDVPSLYEVECFSGVDSLGRVPVGSTVLPGPSDPWVTLIQQPLDPSLYAVVEETSANAPEVGRFAGGSAVQVDGRSFPVMVANGPRSGVQGMELSFAVSSRDAAEAVWATLGDEDRPMLPVWLVRSRHPLLPPVFFCDAFGVQESGVDLHVGGSQSVFSLRTSEVAPPAPGLVVPTLTYDDLAAVFPTYEEMAAALPTYPEWESAWEYAGAAGGGGA